MAATQFGVVYGTVSKIIIRLIDTEGDVDNSALVAAQNNLRQGEAIAFLNLADFPHPNRTAVGVQSSIGVPAHSGRCAHVSGAKVINIIMADPAVYVPATGHLVQSDVAGIGWDWDGTKLSVKVATVTLATSLVTAVVSVTDPRALPNLPKGSHYIVGGAAAMASVGRPIPVVVL